MSVFIAAAFALLPGAFFSLLLRKRQSICSFITDSIVYSLLLTSAIFWVPGLRGFRFDSWLYVMYILSALGLVGLPFAIKRFNPASWRTRSWPQDLLKLATVVVVLFYAAIVLVRPNIDWDAINYYLFSAVDIAKSNHIGSYFSSWVIPVSPAPNTQPPVLPILYAAAIDVAAMLHEPADWAVRLIAIVFTCGLWAATHRLASRYLSPLAADAAAFTALTLPMLTSFITATPLLLDMAICFLTAAITAEMAYLEQSRRGWLRITLYASATIMTKITGLGIVAFVALAFALTRMPARIAVTVLALVYATFALASLKLGFFTHVVSFWLITAMVAVAVVTLWGVYRHAEPQPTRASASTGAALAILGILPGAAYVIELVRLIGSPAGGYIQSMTHVASPNWSWALGAIGASNPYAANGQPGLPEHFGLGLLLWWGLAPLTNILAIIGFIYAIQQRSPMVPIGIVAFIYEFAWLTIFRLDDFRHLLPVAPMLAVLSVYALVQFCRENEERLLFATLTVAAAAVPFIWIAQQTFFLIPQSFLEPLAWTQYFALSTTALWNVAVYCALLLMAALLLTRTSRARLASVIPVTLTAIALVVLLGAHSWIVALLLLVGALLAWRAPRAFWPLRGHPQLYAVYALLILTAMFEPVIATALPPGFIAHENAVRWNEDFGYIPVLEESLRARRGLGNDAASPGTLLTYLQYGVSWFSLGTVRPFDLNDALVLGRMRDQLADNDLPALSTMLKRYSISQAILPAPNTAAYFSLQRLLNIAGIDIIDALYDPLLVNQRKVGAWLALQMYPSTRMQPHSTAALTLGGTSSNALSDGAPEYRPHARYHSLGVTITNLAPGVHHLAVLVMFTTQFKGRHSQAQIVHTSAPVVAGRASIDLDSLLDREPRSLVSMKISAVAFEYRTYVLDFRSAHFVLLRHSDGYSMVPVEDAFILRPESSIVRSISIASRGGNSRLFLYPAPAWGTYANSHPFLMVSVRGSSACAKGSPVHITAIGYTSNGERRSPYNLQAVATIPGTATIDLDAPRRSGRHIKKLAVRSILVSGMGRNCKVNEEFNMHNLALDELRADEFSFEIPTIPAASATSITAR